MVLIVICSCFGISTEQIPFVICIIAAINDCSFSSLKLIRVCDATPKRKVQSPCECYSNDNVLHGYKPES